MRDDTVTASGDDIFGRLRRAVRRLAGGGEREVAPPATGSKKKLPAPEWVLLESVHSAAMGSLHRQVLDREGIPVMEREFGGGSALLGGVPVGVSLFVPANRLAEALAILGQDPALGEGVEPAE